jgi:signal transduction histidine kinase
VVGLGLMLLATVRQIVVSLEYEQLRREQETARAHEEALIEANRRVEEFLGIVSHELKTPLTSLIGTIQLMAQRIDALTRAGAGPEDRARALGMVRELVRRCDSSLFRIGRLVNDLVDDARIREGQLEVEFERCDLRTVVADAVEEQRLLAPTRTIRLLARNSDPILVHADPSRLAQVVSNYVSNALKYSREGQPVVVRVHVMGGMGCVTVRDKGVGLPIVEHDQIWDRFHRAAGVAVQSGSDVGLGIGLHISKTIIERHGGQVGVRSVPGRGSTFWFTVPLARTPP